MVALFAIRARRVAYFIAAWLLALPLAHADPAGDAAASAAGPLSKELEGHLWRIAYVAFERSRSYRDNDIYPAGNDGSEAYITFENGEISGSLGCGELMGRYSLSDDGMQISAALPSNDRKRCGSQFRGCADEVILALRNAVRLERGEEDAFHLFDEQKTYSIRLELLSPGFDLSEFRGSFWRLVSLEGKPIAEPDAEVRLESRAIEISMSKFRAEFAFRYRLKKFSFRGPWSTTGGRDLPPLFETFEQALDRIASYSADGDELAAMDVSGQQIMLLKRIRSAGLEYRYWHIAQYGLDGWLNPTINPPQVITFVQGELRGIAGCRGWSGNYTLAGDSLSVHAGYNSGSGSCPLAIQNEERIVLYVLNKASRVKEDGARLLLQDAQGNTHIVLVPYAQQTPHQGIASGLAPR